MKLGERLPWILRRVLSGAVDSDVHLFVADDIKLFDTVDRGIFDRVLSSMGLPARFRHAYFEYHAHVRFRFKLAAGLVEPWTRDGGVPQGCPLSMMLIVAFPDVSKWLLRKVLSLSCMRIIFECVSRDPGVLLRAAWLTTGYVRLVGQELAPGTMYSNEYI